MSKLFYRYRSEIRYLGWHFNWSELHFDVIEIEKQHDESQTPSLSTNVNNQRLSLVAFTFNYLHWVHRSQNCNRTPLDSEPCPPLCQPYSIIYFCGREGKR